MLFDQYDTNVEPIDYDYNYYVILKMLIEYKIILNDESTIFPEAYKEYEWSDFERLFNKNYTKISSRQRKPYAQFLDTIGNTLTVGPKKCIGYARGLMSDHFNKFKTDNNYLIKLNHTTHKIIYVKGIKQHLNKNNEITKILRKINIIDIYEIINLFTGDKYGLYDNEFKQNYNLTDDEYDKLIKFSDTLFGLKKKEDDDTGYRNYEIYVDNTIE